MDVSMFNKSYRDENENVMIIYFKRIVFGMILFGIQMWLGVVVFCDVVGVDFSCCL